jgi:tRNA pseudouridine55 synthase
VTISISQSMTGPRQERRSVDGVLLLDKPLGISSQTAVTRAKHLFLAAKAGHTGTLDPMASGLLPVCFGEATKFSQMLLNSDKTYAATVRLGMSTTTGDMEGEVTRSVTVHVAREEVETVLRRFAGEIMQTPPMYSAVKHAGRPLYQYARAGRELPRLPRKVNISVIDLVDLRDDALSITVKCGKGTYIRVLAEDIGEALGCGACLAVLRRTAVGGFQLSDGAITLEALQAVAPAARHARLMPVDSLVASLPRIDLDPAQMRQILTGRGIECYDAPVAGLTRVYGPERDFLGIAQVQASGRIVPQRLVAQNPQAAAGRSIA